MNKKKKIMSLSIALLVGVGLLFAGFRPPEISADAPYEIAQTQEQAQTTYAAFLKMSGGIIVTGTLGAILLLI